MLDRYSLKQHVCKPTHVGGNLLDVIATPDSDVSLVSHVSTCLFVCLFVCFSDHSVVSCRPNLSWTAPTIVSYQFRYLRCVDRRAFSDNIVASRRRSTCSRRPPASTITSTFSSARCSDSSTYMHRCRPDAVALVKMNVAGYPTRCALASAAVGVWSDAIGVFRPRGIVRRIQMLGHRKKRRSAVKIR